MRLLSETSISGSVTTITLKMRGLDVVLTALLFTGGSAQTRPNIVFILADDLGWNDVGFTGRSELQTPNIDALAYNGRILTQHYSLPTCTPTRSALLTGKYPIRTGMQGLPLLPNEPRALPLDQRLLPQYMKQLGYQTHLLGKWHLGYHEWRYTPTARGFDSHYGYLSGFISYFDHVVNVRNMSGHDFWCDTKPLYGVRGRYVTDLLTEEAVRLINASAPVKSSGNLNGTPRSRGKLPTGKAFNNKKKAPLFLYVAHLAVHSGNIENKLEYPEEDLERFDYISDINRRKYAAMVWNLDKSVGTIVKALADSGMLNNTIIVFASDNGAPTVGTYGNDGSNYPLRGLKSTLLEGGVRTVAAVWSPQLFTERRGVSRQLFHISDWLPTLFEAAGGEMREVSGLDGHSQWAGLHLAATGNSDAYTTDEDAEQFPARRELLINIDETRGQQAVRYRQWKLLNGTYRKGVLDGYFGNYSTEGYVYSGTDVNKSLVSKALRSLSSDVATKAEILALRKAVTIHCEQRTPRESTDVLCNLTESACLFDVRADPCETSNVASMRPDVVAALSAKLETYMELLKPQLNVAGDPLSDPRLHNNTWIPWLDRQTIAPASASSLGSIACTVLAALTAAMMI